MFEKIVEILLPVFVIVGLGYFVGRRNILGEGSNRVLARFVTQVSLPVLLFGALASENIENILDVPFLAAFGTAILACFGLPWLLFRSGDQRLGVRAMRAMGASFPSVAFVGVPLLTPLIGSVALAAIGLSNLVAMAPVTVSIVLLDLEHSGGSFFSALRTALLHAVKNPIIVGTLAGFGYSLSGLPLPEWINQTSEFLGGATPPVALFLLGSALVGKRLTHLREIGTLTAVKLIVMPLIALGVMLLFPQVDPRWAVSAVVLAAIATATLEFMLADEYHEYLEEASALVFLTTLASAVTLPIFILLSLHIWPIS